MDYEADPSTQPEESREALYAWRPIDVAYRVENQCDLLYYFMQSTSFTPQLLSKFLANLTEQVGWIAPITVYPGEDELLALAQGALRVLNGEEPARVY